MLEGYGLTETTAALTANLPDAIKVGTVGRPLPGTAVRVADDGELLFRGGQVMAGYWRNEESTAEVLERDGWFHTGDLGEVDDEGFVRITGRKKEILVTAGGKNVAPAVLEDRLRGHLLVDQCLVVGDGQPFIAALVTIDRDSFPTWAEANGKSGTLADLIDDLELRAEIQNAVDEANKAVSKAESIRKFTILADEWTEEGGQLTPSLKLKRNVVMREFSDDVAALYAVTRLHRSTASELPGDRDPGQHGRVRAEPELRPGVRRRVGERAQRELALQRDEGLGVAGGLERVDVGTGLDLPADGVLDRRRQQGPQRQQRQHQGHHRRVAHRQPTVARRRRRRPGPAARRRAPRRRRPGAIRRARRRGGRARARGRRPRASRSRGTSSTRLS